MWRRSAGRDNGALNVAATNPAVSNLLALLLLGDRRSLRQVEDRIDKPVTSLLLSVSYAAMA